MIATIESATVRRGDVSNWHEARTAPDISRIARDRGVDIVGERVVGRWRHGHQLQLMSVANAGAVLRGQHGEGRPRGGTARGGERAIGVYDDPVVPGSARCGGESEAGETAGDLHLTGSQRSHSVQGFISSTVDAGACVTAVIAVIYRTTDILTDQPPEIAGAAHAAHGIALLSQAMVI